MEEFMLLHGNTEGAVSRKPFTAMEEFVLLEGTTEGAVSHKPYKVTPLEEFMLLEGTTERAALEEPVAGVAMEAPSVDAVTEEDLFEGEEEFSPGPDMEEATEVPHAKKLLVLDVNGLLVATYHKAQKIPGDLHPFKLGNFYVYERPGCSEFLDFCFKNFVVGVWSSAREHNVTNLVNHIFKDLKQELAFSWHQRHCTTTAVKHPDNQNKPIFLKELSKLWSEVDPGEFDQSNTLLIDDSPYKALKNPPHTAIFPQTYNGDEVDDTFLTQLRIYLEGLRDAPDVQEYVRNNPIGEPGISAESPLWGYFASILNEGAKEVNLAHAVGNGATPAVAVQEIANQLNPEEIELEDMEQPPAKRRALSPVGATAGHSSRREAREDLADEIHWRRNAGNNGLANDRSRDSRRNFERERERSPRVRSNHLDSRRRFATSRERDNFAADNFAAVPRGGPRGNYNVGDYNARRDDRPRGNSWHDRPGARDGTSLGRESFGRRSSEHDIGRALPSPGGRQFMTSGINIRDLPPPPVFSAQEISGRGLLPPPVLPPPRAWENAERPAAALHYDDGYGARRHAVPNHVPLNHAPIEMPRSWEKPVHIPARGREYDRRWEDSSVVERGGGYDRGAGSGWVRPISSGRGSEFDRPRWEPEPVSSGRAGHEYDRRWEGEPMSPAARGSEYDRRWKEPVASAQARGSEFDRRWPREPAAGRDRERGFDSGWDRPASSGHGKEYDSRWGDPAPAPALNMARGGRDYPTRWEPEPVHSDYRKSDYERRWEQQQPPLSSGGSTRGYDPKWSKVAPSQYNAPPPPRAAAADYGNQGGYRNGPSSDADYKPQGRYQAHHAADRNMAHVAPRDDSRPYHYNNSYRR